MKNILDCVFVYVRTAHVIIEVQLSMPEAQQQCANTRTTIQRHSLRATTANLQPIRKPAIAKLLFAPPTSPSPKVPQQYHNLGLQSHHLPSVHPSRCYMRYHRTHPLERRVRLRTRKRVRAVRPQQTLTSLRGANTTGFPYCLRDSAVRGLFAVVPLSPPPSCSAAAAAASAAVSPAVMAENAPYLSST